MRLTCWPFEVEGRGEPRVDTAPPAAPAAPPIPGAAPPVTETAPPVSEAAPPVSETAPSVAGGAPPVISTPPPVTAAPSSLPSAAGPAASVALARPRPADHPRAAALPTQEEARYDVRYGLLGSVGQVTVSVGAVDTRTDGARVLTVRGAGQGAVLGLGSMRRRIESEVDLTSLAPRRWTAVRTRGNGPEGKEAAEMTDRGARGAGNAWTLEREARGQPPARQAITFQARTDDPLSLLWRLRTIPPARGQSETHQLLDGMTLWRVDLTTARTAEILASGDTAIRLDGTLAPIFFDGRPDPDRPTRTFTLWMSDGPGHLPLRLEVPVGLADVVFTLTSVRKEALTAPAPSAQPTPRSSALPAATSGAG